MLHPSTIFSLAPGRHRDGEGLFLYVSADGKRRSWQLKVRPANGSETMVSIGVAPSMGLAAARLAARDIRAAARLGQWVRPTKSTALISVGGVSLADIVTAYCESSERLGHWTPSHRKKTEGQLIKHLGSSEHWTRPVAAYKRADFVRLCEPIEALEVRQRIYRWMRAAIEAAADAGLVDVNPMGAGLPMSIRRPGSDRGTLKGEIKELAGLRELLARSWHTDAALSVRCVHRVCALSGHRIGAVLQARVEHVDLAANVWTVPRSAMKIQSGSDVVIGPLPPALADVLRQAVERAQAVRSPWLFPNASASAEVTHEAVEKHLRRLTDGGPRFSPHSWRSALMTWALDAGYPRETAQAALDHARGTDSDRAYDESQLRAQVAEMLSAWGVALLGQP
jgi:integrase